MELTKQKKITLYLLLAIVLITLGYIAYRKLKAEKGYTDTRPTDYNCRQAKTAAYPLKKGSVGWQVELLQRICNNCPDFNLGKTIATDGIWGTDTEYAFTFCFSKNLLYEDDFEQLFNWYKQYALQS